MKKVILVLTVIAFLPILLLSQNTLVKNNKTMVLYKDYSYDKYKLDYDSLKNRHPEFSTEVLLLKCKVKQVTDTIK